MPHTHHGAFESFIPSAALIPLALVYLCGWVRMRRLELSRIKGWRASSFLTGMLFIWLAVVSPIAALDHQLLTVHMVQHLLLMTLAPPLIWMGTPVESLAHGLPHRFVEAFLAPISRWPSMKRLGKILANPKVGWLAACGTLIGWHIPTLFALGLRSEMWHGIEQLSFLISGLLFWWPVVQARPAVSNSSEWSVLLYLFLATLPCDILSGFLVFGDRVVYPVFLSSPQSFGLSALEDQQCAGALMWTCVTVVYLIAAAMVAARLLSPHRSEERSILQFESEPSAVRTDPQRMEAV